MRKRVRRTKKAIYSSYYNYLVILFSLFLLAAIFLFKFKYLDLFTSSYIEETSSESEKDINKPNSLKKSNNAHISVSEKEVYEVKIKTKSDLIWTMADVGNVEAKERLREWLSNKNFRKNPVSRIEELEERLISIGNKQSVIRRDLALVWLQTVGKDQISLKSIIDNPLDFTNDKNWIFLGAKILSVDTEEKTEWLAFSKEILLKNKIPIEIGPWYKSINAQFENIK